MAQAEVAGHVFAAQVEVAVGEPEVLVGNLVVELEREDLGGVKNVERAGDEFDRAGGQLRVFGSGQTGGDFAGDADHILAAEFVGFLRGVRIFLGTENNLRDAFAVAEVDKNESAVVAAGGDPAAEGDFGAGMFGAEGVAVVGAVGHGGEF